jgi:transcriptional regulator with XRE-family HTH domain
VDEQLARHIGERVRFHRTAARQTKVLTAGLAGISPDYLYQLERGTKLPTIAVLLQLAHALGIPVSKLLDDRVEPAKATTKTVAGHAVYHALTGPAPAQEPPQLPDLRRRIADAWKTWQTSPRRYSEITAQLPGLITDTESALRSVSSDDRRIAHRYSADLHGLVRTVTKRIGRGDLSLLAADRAVRAAEGLRLAEQVDHDRSPSIERRVAFLLDQAKCYQQRRDFASALITLQTAAREAPEDMTHRPSAHATLKSVIRSGRRSVAAEAARLAAQVGMPA